MRKVMVAETAEVQFIAGQRHLQSMPDFCLGEGVFEAHC